MSILVAGAYFRVMPNSGLARAATSSSTKQYCVLCLVHLVYVPRFSVNLTVIGTVHPGDIFPAMYAASISRSA